MERGAITYSGTAHELRDNREIVRSAYLLGAD
jgi:hypothetical protein